MLPLTIPDAPPREMYDEAKNEFVQLPGRRGATVQLEHSLLAISKWEAKWHKSFLSTPGKTVEEMKDYARCMNVSREVRPEVFDLLTADNFREIQAYMDDTMSATTIKQKPGKGPSRRIVTSELIYSWMIDCEIPFSCEKWHINRLFKLIAVRQQQSDPGKKMSKKSVMKQNASLNAARRAKAHSKG